MTLRIFGSVKSVGGVSESPVESVEHHIMDVMWLWKGKKPFSKYQPRKIFMS